MVGNILIYFLFFSFFSNVTNEQFTDKVISEISRKDLDQIKTQTDICSKKEECYLTWTNGVILDNVGLNVS